MWKIPLASVPILVTLMMTAPVSAQELEGGTWRGPDGVPPMIMVVLLGVAVFAAALVVLYTLTLGRSPRHEDPRSR